MEAAVPARRLLPFGGGTAASSGPSVALQVRSWFSILDRRNPELLLDLASAGESVFRFGSWAVWDGGQGRAGAYVSSRRCW